MTNTEIAQTMFDANAEIERLKSLNAELFKVLDLARNEIKDLCEISYEGQINMLTPSVLYLLKEALIVIAKAKEAE